MKSHNNIATGRLAREQRQQEAAARQAEREDRTAEQQVAVLNARLGVDVGARRERSRLEAGL